MDSSSDSPSSRLSALLAPVPVDEFLSKYWFKQHLFCRGSSERFAGLLSWTALNELLAHHWRETHRFRLACRGRDLDPASYADLDGSTPRIRARDVTDHLRRGATLSFDAIDELHEPVTRLAESFEATLRGAAQVNVYVGSRALHGLDLHRDDEEIFILQVEGRKRWLLYGFSVDGVDGRALSGRSVPPAGALLDQILEPGDLLYLPRGCYHVALPLNEPVLHLTVGVRTPRDPELNARPSFSLPWSAMPEPLPPQREFLVTLTGHPRPAAGGDSDAGPVEWRCGDRIYRFPRSMRSIVEQLEEGAPLPLGRLIEAVAGRIDEEMVRMLVGMLLKEGLVAIRA